MLRGSTLRMATLAHEQRGAVRDQPPIQALVKRLRLIQRHFFRDERIGNSIPVRRADAPGAVPIPGSDHAMSRHLQGFLPKRWCYPTLARHFRNQNCTRNLPSIPAAYASRPLQRSRDTLLWFQVRPSPYQQRSGCRPRSPRTSNRFGPLPRAQELPRPIGGVPPENPPPSQCSTRRLNPRDR